MSVAAGAAQAPLTAPARAGAFGCGRLRRVRRGGQRRLAVAEQRRHRDLERRPVGQPILQREHDEPQLRHRAALGLQVDRLGVEQRAADRDDEQAAAAHVRALLVPQRQLTRQLRVLIDARLDLQRTVDQPRLREVVDDRRAVVRAVAAPGDPADQVVAVRRRERQDLDELRSPSRRAASSARSSAPSAAPPARAAAFMPTSVATVHRSSRL